MTQHAHELGAILAEVRRRWTRRERLRAWSIGASAGAATFLLGLLTASLLGVEGLLTSALTVLVLGLVALVLLAALRPFRTPPSDLQLARFIEERHGGLDDVVVTAVQHGQQDTVAARRIAAAAARAIGDTGPETSVASDTLRRAFIAAGVASIVLIGAAVAFAPMARRGTATAIAYLFPARVLIDVTPGTAKVRAGEPLRITARIHGVEIGIVPEIVIGNGEDAERVTMTAAADGAYEWTLAKADQSFPYRVDVGPARSADYAIDVIRPARVERIDLTYRYPKAMGLPDRHEERGGDIYGPAGTEVSLVVTTDKAVDTGALALGETSIPLTGDDTELRATLPLKADGSYRIALTDVDGLENPGETEYFIRLINDRPPDIRVLRPGGDKEVSPIEEVLVEAAAEDDFALASLELVFQTPGKRDTVVPFPTQRAASATGRHLIHLEDLGVRPGDFVTYYARTRDVGQGRQSAETRSDIFFLEVKPFEETFRAAQSQAAGMQGGSPELQELAEAQKEIIAATWKLDARARRADRAGSAADIKAVAEAQRELRMRAAEQASEVAQALADPGRRRPRPGQTMTPGTENPLARAVESMGRASTALDGLKTSEALPHEMAALEQLLKADSDVKDRQIARQQGGGGGSNRRMPDLSTLFDQQLRKQQETNYETPTNTETRPDTSAESDPLARLRELARRQEALQRAQRELAQNRDRLSDEEVKRQLERLTREQQQLSEQTNQLSREMQQQNAAAQSGSQQQEQQQQQQNSQASGASGQQQASSSGSSRRLREIAEQMRGASSDLRREAPDEASARSGRALEQLRELSRQMERARPDERRRAMGDLQFEARQLAEAERRLANEADRTGASGTGDDARRRLAAEQDRLADRADRLRNQARELSQVGGNSGDQDEIEARRTAAAAAEQLNRERVSQRMRAAADGLRQQGSDARASAEGRELARMLDRVAGELGQAAGTADRETERLSDQLARAGELRDRLSEVQRAIDDLQRAADSDQAGQDAQAGRPGQKPGEQGQQGQQGQRGQQGAQPGSTPQQSSSPAQGQSPGQQGSPSQQPGSGGGGGGGGDRMGQLQRDAAARLQEAQRLAGELRQQNSDMRDAPTTPKNWYPSLSAPGTESFKQDFSKWETLKKNLLLALERTESRLSSQLREREARERLNVGGHTGVADEYRDMVDRYYQSLAAPRKPTR
ncbi:MAG: hypothetical protein IT178_11570 [Acidobacteria bacterium]|nr:hypothetical protein [Acidobacteriota bacterium]